MRSGDELIPVLYLAPWVDIGGSDKATVDWFRLLDRERFQTSLITTQPSPNRRLCEVAPYAEELWELPQLMPGDEFPRFILSFIHSRAIRLVHIMNSNLAFELLPDIAALPRPPKVVVQLLGEEPNRSGYVRYAATRFGNLVDCFSLCTHSLSGTLAEYDVPTSKRRVIPTAVDAESDFNPDHVEPITGLDPDAFHILFLARLVEQKDPLLMVDVAADLRKRELRFQLHVVGDGELAGAVRRKIAAAGLGDQVITHGECIDFVPWYAACQAVLLTSRWEGLPTVAYETMAMRLPLVAPSLPGMDELLTPETGMLISPRDDPAAYADALSALASDRALRERLGERARSVVRAEFSLQRMATQHASLYEELLAGHSNPTTSPSSLAPRTRPASAGGFTGRQPGMTPLVSVIVPCFNHGQYLSACLESVAKQSYPSIETVIVDDGSTDADTVAVLEDVERAATATVVRLPSNRGPSAARNAGIDRASGRYVLPLDADDLLVPTAVAELVEQLGEADQRIGFIYPNLQFFGNRRDYLEMPSYNLYALLVANYCSVSSLIDREVFDRGLRFPEDVVFGHEDWDFFLTLAEREIYGEPARTKTLLCRRHGFSRTELIEASGVSPALIEARHPALFSAVNQIKAEWNPGVTVIALDQPGVDDRDAATAAARQTCGDFEVLLRDEALVDPAALEGRLAAIQGPPGSRAQTLSDGIRVAKGRFIVAAYGSLAELLNDSALVEKLLRVLETNPLLAGLALADAASGPPPLSLLDDDAASSATLAALCWPATGPSAPPESLPLPYERPLETLACRLGAAGAVQWRQLGASSRSLPPAVHEIGGVALGAPRAPRARDLDRRAAPPALPGLPALGGGQRSPEAWRPPQTRLLVRHPDGLPGVFTYTARDGTPDRCAPGRVLGSLRSYPLDATISLMTRPDGAVLTTPEPADPDDPGLLGFLEQRPLPLLDELKLGRHPSTGREVLAAGEGDPLLDALEDSRVIGFVVPHPLAPREPPHIDVSYGLRGLVRSVDRAARRHRYAVGAMPEGVPAGELGALLAWPIGECDPLWIDGQGRVVVVQGTLQDGRPELREALRWAADPFTWRGFGGIGPKLRSSARRALDAAHLLTADREPPADPRAEPAGYLLRSPAGRTLALFAAVHPVTGDQLLSTDRTEAVRLGYREPALIGYLIARAPVTGKLGPIRAAAPWASRFGLV